ncbi:histone-like nucleoid-structuring protein Lsr2 [Ornithinimicrobium pekingense]|uniref:Nucleoid-associated protein Lsr2 n=1 Tax=Ornithinimicrobium pekingense TaxID=384677 RepID=A0ABQ2F8W8_9MICO|nr:Lsr2 family protein [Ornithinimicrobium pekingense]GGK64122.1 nucleoid-associated protein Lsr2 [Ornithinimicrobium pekingense]
MAQKVQTILVSDLTGKELGEDGQTLKFGFLGADYEIDLSQQEADEFAKVMQKYTDAARRVGGRRQPGGNRGSAPTDREQLRKMREWANKNGYKVSTRGRIPQEIRDAYHAAS